MRYGTLACLLLASLSLTAAVASALASPADIITVNSTADDGLGTLRQALSDAQNGDTITFDPAVFPPSAPVTIYLTTPLPGIGQGNLTVDASNAGVILDGSNIPEGWDSGLEAVSDGNVIRGFQVSNFTGVGIVLSGVARYNTIGGDRSIGSGPFGQGNLVDGNDMGIGLWGAPAGAASHNTVTGNLIGTDGSGETDLGNQGCGIYVAEGASHNAIGPGNIVAYNGGPGICVHHQNSLHNTITRNSIHGNDGIPIDLGDGGNTELGAPLIFDFDVMDGTVAGAACADCEVEVFSDSSDQGETYEGRAKADGAGAFILAKGAPFAGPHLTATATDPAGNTSEYSAPTTGTRRYLTLQAGNGLPRAALETKTSSELADNRIGSVGLDDGPVPSGGVVDLQAVMDQVVNMGLKSLRFTITRIDGDRVDWDKPELTFEPRHYDFIAGLAANGVMVKYLLIFRDDALGGEGRPYYPRFKTQEEIDGYLDYVRFIIGNVDGLVPYFEIWNEPNIGDCVQWIEVEDYLELVRQVAPVIRQEAPGAKIVLAATTYLIEPEAHDYLFSVVSSDVMPLVDAVQWHPFYGASPEFLSEYYYAYPSVVQDIKDTAAAHGFTGEFMAGEIWWGTEEEPESHDKGIWYSETAAAKYHARGTLMHLGMGVRVTQNAVPSAWPSRQLVDTAVTNLCTLMAGAETTNLPVEIDTQATDVVSASFSLPNGEHLVALWTDGAAVDDDRGTSAILTLPGFSGQTATGMDVLHGFAQGMITSSEGGALVIRDLLVKDYPVILRLAPTSHVFLPVVLRGGAWRQ
ncbi:MAG: right-handed parallel beta-helix repeat-containing protein [Anaerolineae bacterium]|jgi:hypothetical protein